jgi:hypothetical protein
MHRQIEIGLGVLLGLMVTNSAAAAPRDGRLNPKSHGAGAALARTTMQPIGRPVGAGQRGLITRRADGKVAPGSGAEAATRWGSAAGALAYEGYVGRRGYNVAPGAGYAGAPLDAGAVRGSGGFATGRAAYGYAGPPPGGYAVGPARGAVGGFATGKAAYGYAGPPPGGYAVGPARGAVGGFATGRAAYGYAGPPPGGYGVGPARGAVAGFATGSRPTPWRLRRGTGPRVRNDQNGSLRRRAYWRRTERHLSGRSGLWLRERTRHGLPGLRGRLRHGGPNLRGAAPGLRQPAGVLLCGGPGWLRHGSSLQWPLLA